MDKTLGGWGTRIDVYFVQPVLEKLRELDPDSNYFPFTVQLLRYGPGQRRGAHQDPVAYTAIAGLTLRGSGDVSLVYRGDEVTTTFHAREYYIMHGKMVRPYMHFVSPPPVERFSVILRCVDTDELITNRM